MGQFQLMSLLSELKRRKVLRVAFGYAVVMWLLLQIAEVTFEPLRLPEWALTLLTVMAIMGFVFAVVLACAFEVTPGGVKRDPQDRPKNSADTVTRMANKSAYRSVAILPFADMSCRKDQGYFCEGIAEEILNSLSTVKCLRVPSRSSSFRLNTEDHDIRAIGEALNVETVLEGSVRKDADKVRICAQLIDARNGFHIWGRSYDRNLNKIFEIQRELSQDIVRQLCESMNPEEIVVPEHISTADIRAYDYYLQGRHFLNRHTGQSAKFAVQMFAKAVEIDPGISLAWAGLSEAHSYIYLNCANNRGHRESAHDAAKKAVGLVPDSAPSRTALGVTLMTAGRYADADAEFRLALSINPQQSSTSYYFARSCLLQGKLEQAAELYERTYQTRPEDYQAPLLALSVYRRLGRSGAAREAARRGTKAAESRLGLYPDDQRALYLGCLGYLELGETEKGRSWAERAIALNPTDALTRYNVACFYAQLGDIDLALANLSKVGITRKEFIDWMENDPDLDPLRGDQRFESLKQVA